MQTSKPNYKEIDSDEEKRLNARLELKRKAREDNRNGTQDDDDDDDDDYMISSDSSSDSEVLQMLHSFCFNDAYRFCWLLGKMRQSKMVSVLTHSYCIAI